MERRIRHPLHAAMAPGATAFAARLAAVFVGGTRPNFTRLLSRAQSDRRYVFFHMFQTNLRPPRSPFRNRSAA